MQVSLNRSDSAPERVVRQILQQVADGRLRPGEKLPTQERLAEIYGVGRSSIREATNALAIMGYLRIKQGKGTFIAQRLPAEADAQPAPEREFFAGADLFNLVEIREVLECHAVRRAAERADGQRLEALGRAVRALERSAVERERFLQEDLNFHLAVAAAAGLPEAGRIVRVIHTEVNKLLAVVFTTSKPEAVIDAIESARRVYEFILAGDGRQAARCMRNHLDTSTNALKKNALAEARANSGQPGAARP